MRADLASVAEAAIKRVCEQTNDHQITVAPDFYPMRARQSLFIFSIWPDWEAGLVKAGLAGAVRKTNFGDLVINGRLKSSSVISQTGVKNTLLVLHPLQ